MYKGVVGFCLWALICWNTSAQTNGFRAEYEAFRQQANEKYEHFRDEANKKYAEFVRKAWKEYTTMPAIPKPKEEEIPPVTMPIEERENPVEDRPVPIKEEAVVPPAPEPQPVPVSPIREELAPTAQYVSFQLYGTDFRVRFSKEERFTLKSCKNVAIADAWEKLAGTAYNNTIRDCIEIRIQRQLSDWAYLKLLNKMAEACLGKSNEATLLMAFVFCQSGYQMRLGAGNDRLYMLYACKHCIYDQSYFILNGEQFYTFECQESHLSICDVDFPNEKPLSLFINNEQLLANDKSPIRTLVSEQYRNISVDVSVNKNAIAFYNDYPTSMINNDVMTRWAMYANASIGKTTKDTFYPTLRESLKGMNQKEVVERLLNWVQTAFFYEYDDKVWGGDRAFFPEETLYYPYCDCEDRSILFTRLVRDLLGLKCILIYYPGHLASAVCFTENVTGDYININGRKFIVCDPTYIGAPVGRTMPDMDNATAKVILLE